MLEGPNNEELHEEMEEFAEAIMEGVGEYVEEHNKYLFRVALVKWLKDNMIVEDPLKQITKN